MVRADRTHYRSEGETHAARSEEDDRSPVITPAGRCVVDLLKLAGVFVEADAAINKKARRA